MKTLKNILFVSGFILGLGVAGKCDLGLYTNSQIFLQSLASITLLMLSVTINTNKRRVKR